MSEHAHKPANKPGKNLGMDSPITRRDFLGATLLASGASPRRAKFSVRLPSAASLSRIPIWQARWIIATPFSKRAAPSLSYSIRF
jgi:hypothetical protein